MPGIYRQSLVRRPVFSLVRLLVRPWPYRVAPAAGESFGAHIFPIPCSPCHLMPSHVHAYPMVLQQLSQHSQHQSTARIRVPSGPFGLVEKDYCLHFFLFQKFRQGGNSWNLFDFDNQSAAFFCVETIKYCSIPTVPSGLEEFKTRPESPRSRVRSPECSPFVFCVPFSSLFFVMIGTMCGFTTEYLYSTRYAVYRT